MAKIILDLDGVLCTLKKPQETYAEVQVIPGTAEKLQALKNAGHYLIIHTARHMASTGNNVGIINKKVGAITLEWLERNGILYDEIHFGKPHGDVYIDDNAMLFTGWNSLSVSDFDDKLINIVIPMAGVGQRFVDSGYEVPKPLIQIHGKYMFQWSVESFDYLMEGDFSIRLIFIILAEHAEKWNLDRIIHDTYPEAVVIAIPHKTDGQAQTVLAAKQYINNLNKLIIHNGDTFSRCPELLLALKEKNIGGVIPCFESTDPRYSYAKVDEYGYVTQTIEKLAISDRASNGTYYFSKGHHFVWAAEKMISMGIRENNEYYVIPLYNDLIANGHIVRTVSCNHNWILGTPDELTYFENNYFKE